MSENSRKNILNKIEAAQQRRLVSVYEGSLLQEDIYKPIGTDPVACFKAELESINGKCFICKDEKALFEQIELYLQSAGVAKLYSRDPYITEQLIRYNIPVTSSEEDFETMEAGITGCEFLIARTGSVVISSASLSGRQLNIFPPIHIVIAHSSQMVNYPEDAYKAIQEKYGNKLPSMISTITGPSRTADIEKTLVLGAHGPKDFVVFLAEF